MLDDTLRLGNYINRDCAWRKVSTQSCRQCNLTIVIYELPRNKAALELYSRNVVRILPIAIYHCHNCTVY